MSRNRPYHHYKKKEQTMRADAIFDADGKRLRWQCSCRQNGGVQVQAYKPPPTETEMRAAFEKWAVSLDYCVDRFDEGHEYVGNYVFIDVHLAWMAWQEASEVSQ